MMQQIWSIDQAQALVLKAERLVRKGEVRVHILIQKAHPGITPIALKKGLFNLSQNNLSQSKWEARVGQSQ
jgi:hypothetical protein